MKRARLAGVVGEGDGVEEAVEAIKPLREFTCKVSDLVLELYVARKNVCVAHELLHLFNASRIADGVDDFGTGIDLVFEKPIKDAPKLAQRLFAVCGDLCQEYDEEDEDGNPMDGLAVRLKKERRVRLWWD